jgi:hypothetical protein
VVLVGRGSALGQVALQYKHSGQQLSAAAAGMAWVF